MSEATSYFGSRGSHCLLVIAEYAGKADSASLLASEVPTMTLTPEELLAREGFDKGKATCKDALVLLSASEGVEDVGRWLPLIPVGFRIVFVAQSADVVKQLYPRLRRLPRAFYLIPETRNATASSKYLFSLHKRPSFFKETLAKVSLYSAKEGDFILAAQVEEGRRKIVRSSSMPDLLPDTQLDYGNHDIPAVAFKFFPYSVPDYETQQHTGFEFEIVHIVTK